MSESKLKKWYGYVSVRRCLVCDRWPVEMAHIKLLISPKTGMELGRRVGINKWAVVPLCEKCHRTGKDSIHNIGEQKFFENHGITMGTLLRVWTSWFVAWSTGEVQ